MVQLIAGANRPLDDLRSLWLISPVKLYSNRICDINLAVTKATQLQYAQNCFSFITQNCDFFLAIMNNKGHN